ncbi:MAG: hypothetical protein IKO10_06925 [Lachnospiraceae bacterium]|nr:hypothetical protein [Lachnospiraceae bacterium]
MIGDMTVIMLSAAVFLALILYIALEQEQREKVTGATFFLAYYSMASNVNVILKLMAEAGA